MKKKEYEKTCWCGCGEGVLKYYSPGHDQRHLQAVIRTHTNKVQALLEFPTQAMRDRFIREVTKHGNP